MSIFPILRKAAISIFGQEFLLQLLKKTVGEPISMGYLDDLLPGERLVEYVWAFQNLKLEQGKILDVGCHHSLFPIALASQGFDVWAIDLKNYGWRHPNFKFVRGDILSSDLPTGFFDRITAISTIEHIGLTDGPASIGDIEAISRMADLLAPKGSIMCTIPYGNGQILKDFRIYDEDMLSKLIGNLVIDSKDIFIRRGDSWLHQDNKPEIKDISANIEKGVPEVNSVACLKLSKPR